ncbi:hypothetical protein RQP46_006282 [Phenoliferia psychrophenolica]
MVAYYCNRDGCLEASMAGVDPPMLVCGGCRVLRYCSKECQKEHWSAHKTLCKEIKAESAFQSRRATEAASARFEAAFFGKAPASERLHPCGLNGEAGEAESSSKATAFLGSFTGNDMNTLSQYALQKFSDSGFRGAVVFYIDAPLARNIPAVSIRKAERCKEQLYEETKDLYNIVTDDDRSE